MKQHRLLVISTDIEIAQMLQIYFTRLEYEVECVSTLEEALAAIDLHRPALILFDSDKASSELKTEKSKLSEVLPNVPLIWIVAKDDRPDRIDGLELGIDDYVSKLFDIEELKLRAQNAIRASKRLKGQ